ncbi:MAG: bifunctional riboflavin kinase/FAD synthetase [Polyangiaceae bacterium]
MTPRVDGSSRLQAPAEGSLVAIGNFDGVHRGHQHVVEEVNQAAAARRLAPLVLTFHPHPAAVLGKKAPDVLTVLERKIELLVSAAPGMRVVVEPFDLELSRWSPERFAEQLLVGALNAKLVVVGQNFRFGRGRAGDLHTLEALGQRFGFEARALPLVSDAAGVLSSSRVRTHVAAGELDEAQGILGRPHSLSGQVVRGDARGRALGFPTANLEGVAELLPPDGVYACAVDAVETGPRALSVGVANIGHRPTVEAGFSVEAHLLDFEGDLYGAHLRLHLLARLRPEQRFAGLDALRQQIGRDVEHARTLIPTLCPPRPAQGGFF